MIKYHKNLSVLKYHINNFCINGIVPLDELNYIDTPSSRTQFGFGRAYHNHQWKGPPWKTLSRGFPSHNRTPCFETFNPAPVHIFACTVVVTTRMGKCDISLPRDLHFIGRSREINTGVRSQEVFCEGGKIVLLYFPPLDVYSTWKVLLCIMLL